MKLRLALAVLLLAPLLPSGLLAQSEPLVFKPAWGYLPGSEFPGASGTLDTSPESGEGVALLSYDFTLGGVYVGVRGEIEVPAGYSEIRLRVRSATAQTIALRLRDATGQWHQNEFAYERAGEWSPIRWDLSDFKSKLHWGGRKDGKLHYPVKEIQVLVNKTAGGAPLGTVEIAPPLALP